MHSYSVDTDVRKSIILIITLISIPLSMLINRYGFDPLGKHMDSLFANNDIYEMCKCLGVILENADPLFVFGILYKLYEEKAWKWSILKKYHNLPDLNGIWQGELESSYKDQVSGNNKKIAMTLEIKQTWSKISFIAHYPQSDSYSHIAGIRINDIAGTVILFGFINENSNVDLSDTQYEGFNKLVLNGDKLVGHYFTNRGEMTRGVYELHKVN